MKMLLAGTVMDIPLSATPSGAPVYQILFDNGMAASIPLVEMASIIPPPLISDTLSPDFPLDAAHSLLPPFLMVGSLYCTLAKYATCPITMVAQTPCYQPILL
jgi:hypothetical protein